VTIKGQTLHVEDDETGGPAFFWINPWTGKREKLASLLWPLHPPEVTDDVDAVFSAMTLSIYEQPPAPTPDDREGASTTSEN
jgi:hypothetical protein